MFYLGLKTFMSPLIGKISAGIPHEAIETTDFVTFPNVTINKKAIFLL